eukprot:403361550
MFKEPQSLEQLLKHLSNQTLRKECKYFNDISPQSQNTKLRNEYIEELKTVFQDADIGNKGEITRREFERLILGYFELKAIRSTRQNYDRYFKELDVDNDKSISFKEFLQFADQVNEQEIMPIIESELHSRGLM